MKLFLDESFELPNLEIKSGKCIATDNLLIDNTYLGLEEFLFEKTDEESNIDKLLELIDIARLETHYAIIDDTSFAYFTRLFTEKVTRNKIEIATGVAADTGLFNEEYLPEESILYTAFGFTNEFKENGGLTDENIKNYFETNFKDKPLFQLGGNKSIGKGLVKAIKLNQKSNEKKEVEQDKKLAQ